MSGAGHGTAPSEGWRDRARRAALVPLLALTLAGPGLSLVSPRMPGPVRLALIALTILGVARPSWSPAVLVGLVPLLPVWPSLVPTLPDGLVHLVVATQAVPWLVRRLVGARGARSTAPPGWALLVGVATVSLLVALTPEPWRGADFGHVWRQIQSQVPAYVFEIGLNAPRALAAWTVLLDGLLCALVVSWATTRATRVRVLRAAAVAAVLTALFGMVQAATGYGLQTAWRVFDAGIVRINATYVDPNALAAFYALVGPVLAGLAMRSSGARRVAWGVGLLVVLVAVVMTAGRAGLAALAAGGLITIWLALRLGLDEVDASPGVRRHARRVATLTARGLAALVAALVLAGTLLDIRHEQQTTYLHTWLYTFNLRQPPDAIAKGRIAVWRVALAMVRERPLVGQGVGEAPAQFERVRAKLGIDSLPRDARLSPHDTYLLVTSELGLLGLAAFLLLLIAIAMGIRAPGNLPPRDAGTWPMAGLVGGLAAYTLTMLTGDRILLREDVVIGTVCATVATLGAPRLPRWWRTAAFVVMAVTLASWPVRTGWIGGPAVALRMPPNEGLHPDQVGARGETYRWTTGDTVLYVPAGAHRVRIPLRNLSPDVQQVHVEIDDRPADLREIPPGPWEMLDYRLPPRPDGRWHAIHLKVSPTWQAPGDARVLGVVIGDWGFSEF